jgi:Uma2 family endonuclease
METLVLNVESVDFTDAQFDALCQTNKDWKFERTAKGELIIMSPVGGVSGYREADLITDLNIWNRQTKRGIVFSSSTIFRLPNGGFRSPDAAWIELSRWENLTLAEKEAFPPICPDFVIELRSRTDSLKLLKEKMEEYLDSGLKLGWLINPQGEQVEIYRGDRSIEIVNFPVRLSGENVLPGFVLDWPLP